MLQVSCRPFGDEDTERAEFASRFLRWTLQNTLNWEQVAADLIFDGLLDSAGIAKIRTWEPPWDAPSEDARRFLRRQVMIDACDLGMLLIAPDAEGLQYPESRYVAQEFFLSSDDILRMEDKGFDTPAWDQLGDSQEPTERKRVEMEREGERVIEFRPDSTLFVESYERFPLEGGTHDQDVIVSWFPDAQIQATSHNTDSNHGRIAGVRRLTDVFPQDDRPRRPFFPITFWQQPRQWRGLNVPDRLESMQDCINKLHEQLINYGEISMLPYAFIDAFMTGELPDLRTVRPGSTVPIDNVNGIQFAPTRSLNRHFAEQIQMMQANVERDTRVTDFNQGRSATGTSNASTRTASGQAMLLAESKKSFGMLVRRAATQFSQLLAFDFRLWQAILPDDTYASMFDPVSPQDVVASASTSSALWERLFAKEALSDTGRPAPTRRVALPINKELISGLFDIDIEVNPEEQFDRQVMTSLWQVTAPLIQDYPMGIRLMLKRMWSVFDQRGFDDIYPEEIATLQTQERMLTKQVQIATLQMQLEQLAAQQQQIAQQQAQQQHQQLQAEAQQFHQTGAIGPNLLELVQSQQGQGAQASGAVPPGEAAMVGAPGPGPGPSAPPPQGPPTPQGG
jgi:hypothetical protein